MGFLFFLLGLTDEKESIFAGRFGAFYILLRKLDRYVRHGY